MNAVDSSGWLEYFADGSNAEFFAKPIIPSVSIYEVFKRVLQQRDKGAALQAVALMQQGTVIDLGTTRALNAASLSHELRLRMADGIVLATARAHKAMLRTQGDDFEGIAGVRYVAKSGQR